MRWTSSTPLHCTSSWTPTAGESKWQKGRGGLQGHPAAVRSARPEGAVSQAAPGLRGDGDEGPGEAERTKV